LYNPKALLYYTRKPDVHSFQYPTNYQNIWMGESAMIPYEKTSAEAGQSVIPYWAIYMPDYVANTLTTIHP
jgi:hypothetical protein